MSDRAAFLVSGDELIPRCAENGERPARADSWVSVNGAAASAYESRVSDARSMLRAGKSRAEVREKHGGIVLQDAELRLRGAR